MLLVTWFCQDISGMSWQEETDIRRALNASIRRSYSRQDSCSSVVNTEHGSASTDGQLLSLALSDYSSFI